MAIIDRLQDLTRPTGQEDSLRVDYPDQVRVHVPVRQALAVAFIIVLAVAAWVFLSSRPSETFTGSAPVAVTAEEPAAEMVVSVVGAVAEPGLVTLPAGARVADALTRAQPLPEADLPALNQAQLLVDGQQILVPAVGDAPAPAGGHPAQVSLNSADAASLMELPGVGEATAAAIIAHREQIGGFTAPEQLLDVKGIGPAKFEKISAEITL
ncbi:ComEA family DNA-binding protein [Corynebacterium guangdongense]|uniref:Competence protein ComEA n=1 Tax=Corynebacterium guangdongense TaxID=1783348 RepID=A0ABU1ZYN7_9CORY|nr:ComEA family DNA-binding protein [Corynebacterium guangdongense]MDR7330026.1 competence protein ComEA [Corynebacterium guangdongense]WJZ18584.1 ComE operon protein 1 [Corynebacterium guangdongense]